jgi:3-oxoacyl-[acyl-carrier protein] reductase
MGRVIASQLAADGFDVAVAYAGSVDLADATVKEIAGHGRRGEAFAADIADEEATSAVFDAVEDPLRASRRRRAYRRDQPSRRADGP